MFVSRNLFDKSRRSQPSNITVVAGSLHRENYDEGTQVRTAVRHIVHPNYSKEYMLFNYDMVLLKLDRPFEINEHVRTVCLETLLNSDLYAPGKKCIVAGWGFTARRGKFAPTMKSNHTSLLTSIFIPSMKLKKNTSYCRNQYLYYRWNGITSHCPHQYQYHRWNKKIHPAADINIYTVDEIKSKNYANANIYTVLHYMTGSDIVHSQFHQLNLYIYIQPYENDGNWHKCYL